MHVRALLAGALAAAALALAVDSSSANRFSVNETRWRHVWNPLTFKTATSTIECPITIEGSFHSSVSQKTAGALTGYVSGVSISNPLCTGGHLTLLQATLPWHVTYVGFSGTLPNITAVTTDLLNAGFQLQPLGSLACLARMTPEHPGRSIIALRVGTATSIRADETAEIPLTGALGACPFSGSLTLSGIGAITRLGSTGSIAVTLI